MRTCIQLVKGAMIKSIASITVGHLITLAIIEGNIQACGEAVLYGCEQLVLFLRLFGVCSIGDKERKEPAGATVQQRHQPQFPLSLYETVQIHIGMYLLHLFLVQERQSEQLLTGGGIDVHGIVMQQAQFLHLYVPLLQSSICDRLISGLFLIVTSQDAFGIFLNEIVPCV